MTIILNVILELCDMLYLSKYKSQEEDQSNIDS